MEKSTQPSSNELSKLQQEFDNMKELEQQQAGLVGDCAHRVEDFENKLRYQNLKILLSRRPLTIYSSAPPPAVLLSNCLTRPLFPLTPLPQPSTIT